MPIEKTILLYQYSELSPAAQERARQWFAECLDSSDYETVIADAVEVAEILGVSFHSREYKTVSGATRTEPAVYWSGFGSQGDGASFDGAYRYARDCVRKMKGYAPQDGTLHSIAQRLADVQRKHFYALRAVCKVSGHYVHSHCMAVDVEHADGREVPDQVAREVRDCLRRFADWIFGQLCEQDHYLHSDEYIAEMMQANEYTFTADGKRHN